MEQTQQKPQFPTEEVTLPSKGLLYPEGHPLKSGKITMKYMTAREEDILTNQNYIKNGTVIDKLLKSLVVNTTINLDDMLIGDKNAILVASRILGYGSEYSFQAPHPETGESEEITIDLTDADDKHFDEKHFNGDNEFEFQCPHSKILLTFKLLTQGDERKIENEIKGLKKISKLKTANLTTRLKHMITSVNGDRDIKVVRDFIDNQFLARDSRAFRDHSKEIMPDIDLRFDLQFSDGTIAENIELPISVNFFWPDASV
jgi:hypothetical protein